MSRPRFRTHATFALVVLAASPVMMHARPAAAQSVGTDSAAQQRYARGRELFFAKSYAEALKEFRAANELVASPNTRLYIARCERELGHNASAFVEYQRAASEAADRARTDPRYTTTRDHARSESAALEPKLARLVVKVTNAPEGATVSVGGQPLPRAGWDLPTPIDPGEVEVVANAAGRAPFKKKVTAAAGQTAEITVVLEDGPPGAIAAVPVTTTTTTTPANNPGDGTPLVEPPGEAKTTGGGVRTLGFVTLGVGVVGIAGFAIFAGMAKSRFDEVKTACGGHRCANSSNDGAIDGGERMQTIANVSLAVGCVAAAIGLVMVTAGGPSSADPPKTAASLKLWGGPLDQRGGMVGARIGF
ncbi:MAG: hypothetical protein JWM74_3155 [Myxococcaceae bacterium]|nr:hypothetical protein [Myxococcaceae bacterium]